MRPFNNTVCSFTSYIPRLMFSIILSLHDIQIRCRIGSLVEELTVSTKNTERLRHGDGV